MAACTDNFDETVSGMKVANVFAPISSNVCLKKNTSCSLSLNLLQETFSKFVHQSVYFFFIDKELKQRKIDFLYDFFVANVSTIKMLCSTQQFMFMNGNNVLHNKNHFVFTIHDKQYTSVTLSM